MGRIVFMWIYNIVVTITVVQSSTIYSSCATPTNINLSSNATISYSELGNYPSDAHCTWRVTAPVGKVISGEFTRFHTEKNYDFVYIYDGSSSSDPLIGKYHGSNLPPSFLTSSNELFVKFTTDVNIEYQGFEIKLQAQDPELDPGECEELSLINIETIYTLKYPASGDYLNNMMCSWRIYAPSGTLISGSFINFDTETGYDTVSIIDGAFSNQTELGEYSGTSLPAPFETTANSLYIIFTSDVSVVSSGFEIYLEVLFQTSTAMSFSSHQGTSDDYSTTKAPSSDVSSVLTGTKYNTIPSQPSSTKEVAMTSSGIDETTTSLTTELLSSKELHSTQAEDMTDSMSGPVTETTEQNDHQPKLSSVQETSTVTVLSAKSSNAFRTSTGSITNELGMASSDILTSTRQSVASSKVSTLESTADSVSATSTTLRNIISTAESTVPTILTTSRSDRKMTSSQADDMSSVLGISTYTKPPISFDKSTSPGPVSSATISDSSERTEIREGESTPSAKETTIGPKILGEGEEVLNDIVKAKLLAIHQRSCLKCRRTNITP